MKINISGSIDIPDWAEVITQDKYGDIYVFDCAMNDLEIFQDTHVIKEGTGWTEIDCVYDSTGLVIRDWESRKFNLKTDKVSIIDGVLTKLC